MSQNDKKKLSDVARSIEALFAGEEGVESTATVPSSGEEERHPDVSVSLGLESALDSYTGTDSPAGTEDASEVGAGVSVTADAPGGDALDGPVGAGRDEPVEDALVEDTLEGDGLGGVALGEEIPVEVGPEPTAEASESDLAPDHRAEVDLSSDEDGGVDGPDSEAAPVAAEEEPVELDPAVAKIDQGSGSIEDLTGSLADENAEVRRETVRSLAQIGGESAGILVSSMLGDSDPKVRVAAALAVTELKVERAYKQLVEILEKKKEEDVVIEEVLRALGALGDASAVPAIEKRVKRSLFSRPSTEVRLAGLAALASIGTPHAVSLVKKARNDKDPEISAAAAKLLR